MQTTRIAVGAERFVLAPQEDVDLLAEAIVRAVRVGGDFVDLSLATGRLVRILVTTGSTISLETVEWDPDDEDDEQGELTEGSRLHFDGEYWLE